MGMTIYRPGQRLIVPNARVMQTSAPAATLWWLAGGILAANAVVAYAPKGAADLASSYINLANPGTNNAAPGVAPTWDAVNGWILNGTTQYLTTGIVPAAGYSVIIRYSAFTAGTAAFGSLSTSAVRWFIDPSTAGVVRYARGADLIDRAPGLTSGVLAMTAERGYRNGVADGADFVPMLGAPDRAAFAGARNNGGTADQFIAIRIQAFAIYNATLTSGQNAALYTAIAAL